MRYVIPLLAVFSPVLLAGCASAPTGPTAAALTPIVIESTSCESCAAGRYCAPCVTQDGQAVCRSCASVIACSYCAAQHKQAGGATAGASAPTAQPTATVYANGMTCPQCASKVDRRVRKVAGVDWTQIDLSTGRVTFGLKPGVATPSAEALQQAVSDAGYTAGVVTLPDDEMN